MKDFLNAIQWLKENRPQDTDLAKQMASLTIKVFPGAISEVESLLNQKTNNIVIKPKESTMKKYTLPTAGTKPKKLVPHVVADRRQDVVDNEEDEEADEIELIDVDDLVAMASLTTEQFAGQFKTKGDIEKYATQYGIELTTGTKKADMLIELQAKLADYVSNPD